MPTLQYQCMNSNYQCYFRFTIEGVNYQFTCLPFGLTCAPWAFTKIMKAVVALLRSRGTRIVIYVDDILIISESAVQAGQHLKVFNLHPPVPGLYHQEKLVMTPTQELEFLGIMVNNNTAGFSLRRQGEADMGRGSQNIQHDYFVSPPLVSFSGKAQCSNPSYPPSSTVLPLLTERPTSSLSRQQSELRGPPNALTRFSRRTVLVERTSIME